MSYTELAQQAQQAQHRDLPGRRAGDDLYWVQCFFDTREQAMSAYTAALDEFCRDDRWRNTSVRMPNVSFQAFRMRDAAHVAIGFLVVNEIRDPEYQDWLPSVVYLDASLDEATRRAYAEYHTRRGVIVHNGSRPGLALVNLLEER